MQRRDFLRLAGAAAGTTVASSAWSKALAASQPGVTGPSPYGPLLPPDANGIQLPARFRSRVVARSGEVVADTGFVWPIFPDGGATFSARGGWIYVANTEWVPPDGGGVSAIRFDRSGRIVDAYSICSGTTINCAGGATPWGTWLTCEEHPQGAVWECDPSGEEPQVERPALGTFQHEAVAVDPIGRRLYLTEDVGDGRLYRFTPRRWGRLEAGRLEVAAVGARGSVDWHEVPEPNPATGGTPTRLQVPESTAFRGGEGIAYSQRRIYFTTKGDNRVWELDLRTSRLRVIYDRALDPGRQLGGVDNVLATPSGDLVIAEDGDNMELVLITPDGAVSAFLRVVGQDGSELAGPALDPSGTRLYFSSQRGDDQGITYEVSGPFRRSALQRQPLPRLRLQG